MSAPTQELNLRIAASLLRYVLQRYGPEAHAAVLSSTDVTAAADGTADGWVSHEQFEEVLLRSRNLMESDREFSIACVHEGMRNYGPVIHVLRAGNVRGMFLVGLRTLHLVSKISKFKLKDDKNNDCRFEYRSTKKESRLMCLSRQAAFRAVPQIFWPDYPPATVQEESCIANGDDACVYHVRWAETLRTRWVALGALVGAGVAFFLPGMAHELTQPLLALLPILGGAVGLASAYAENARSTARFQAETTKVIEDLVLDRERAVFELRSMNQREQAYSGLLEERVRVRTAQLEEVIQQVVALQERQSMSLRGLSHDMRSPLQILTFLSFRLRSKDGLDAEGVASEIDESVRRLRDQLAQLASVATNQPDAFALRTTTIRLDAIAERIKAHLDALLLGRAVSASCFRTREAPESIESDATLFDRILDNIVTNAAKYTDRGSIVVEISGGPGTLSIKVSDTGRGISPDRLEHVFTGTEKDANPAVGDSLGIGLANTVQLLDQVGGRLEVMSRPSMGTTVWIHLPVEREVDPPESARALRAAPSTAIKDVVARVVRIRAAL